MSRTLSTPLLELLNQRWDEFIKDIPDPTLHEPAKRPVFATLDLARQAARLHAQANHSDPFAYGRAMRYIRQGFWSIGETRADALAKINSRKGAGVVLPFAGLTGERT